MKLLERAAIVLALRERLEALGSWCGETHLQKALYLLQTAEEVPLQYSFILYKYGPFAFDLREEVARMRADGLLEKRTAQSQYGPRYFAGPYSDRLLRENSAAVARYSESIERIAGFVGNKGIYELERLATALLLIEQYPGQGDEEIARQLNEVKPHVDRDSALSAVHELRHYKGNRHRT